VTEANTLGYRAYQDDDSEALISKSTWSLKISGLVFAGLLVLGRSASYGQITWTPTFHQAGSPLVVTISTAPRPVPPPTIPKISPADPGAMSKKSAASEIVKFSPGKNAGPEDPGDDQGNNGENGSGATAAGHTAPQSGNGTPVAGTGTETGESGVSAGHSTGAAGTGTETGESGVTAAGHETGAAGGTGTETGESGATAAGQETGAAGGTGGGVGGG